MKIPDFESLGEVAPPRPSRDIAVVSNPGATGEGQEIVGASAEKAGTQLQDMVDRANTMQAINSYTTQAAELGAQHYALQGKNAIDDMGPYIQRLNNLGSQINDSLTTNQSRLAFQTHVLGVIGREQYSSAIHAGQQAVQFSNQQFKAHSDLQMTNYANNIVTDPATANDARLQDIAALTNHLKHDLGYDDDTIADVVANRNADYENQKQASQKDYMLNLPLSQSVPTVMSWGTQTGGARNMGGDTVQPYSAERIADVRAKLAAPSPYDASFQKYAQEYGVDPQELKLHGIAESDLNPKADNGQAQGLMQLTPGTAKALGVTDPFDADQSIRGAAQLMAQQKIASGGDTGIADKLYYAGADTGQWGKNTAQYAENLAAVRGTTALATATTPTINGVQVEPQTAAIIAKAVTANQSEALRLQKEQQAQTDLKTETDFVPKWASGQLSSKDVIDSALSPEKKITWLDRLEKGDPKVNPNSADVITQRGILQNMQVDDPKAFVNTDMSSYAGKLPATDIAKFQEAQMKMRQGDTSIEAQNKQAKEITDSVADMFPVDWRDKKDQKSQDDASAFKGNLVQAVQQAQAAGGKPVSRDDIRKMASDMLGDVVVKGSVWNSTEKAYQVPSGTNPASVTQGPSTGKTITVPVAGKTIDVPDNMYVPETFREYYSRIYQSRFGSTPTEGMIKGGYLTSLQQPAG